MRSNSKESNVGDSVVAFSDQRPEKISEPFATLGDGYTAITIESSTYSPFRYVRATVEAVRKVWRNRPEVILTDHFGPLSTIAAMLGLVFRVPVVVRIGGDPLGVKCRKVRDRLRNHQLSALPLLALMLNIKFIMMLADGYVTVSESLKETIVENFDVSPDRVHVVPVSIRAEQICNGDPQVAREEWHISEPHVILTVTNLKFEGKYDALNEMAPAVVEILVEHPNLAWIIAGDGKYRTQLQNDIDDATNSNAVRDRVYILGHVDSIANLYAVADVFLYFSYIDAYPNVILEAQANALPVIANPDHGIVEQITDGETGTFVGMSQFEEARSELRSLLSDESYRRELGTAAAEQVRRENSPEKIGVLLRRNLNSAL